MKTTRPRNACPHCWSMRAQRSHRRTSLERLLHRLGAEIRRCRDCRFRHALFGRLALPLVDPESIVKRWTTHAALFSGCAVCIILVLWVIRRLTGLSG